MVFFQDKLSRNKTVLANFSYLSILQVFTILFPLLTYPYLLRVIGLELYGVIVFAQAIINYVSLVINFGFNMSGARKVAVYKEDKVLLSRIVSSTYLCKLILWLICLVVYLLIISLVPFFKDYYWVYVLSFLLTFNELLLPIWFFQGIEKMKYITIVNLSARLLFVVAIFLFVREREVFIYCVGKGENKIVRDTYAGIEIGLSGEFPVVRVEFVHTDLRECKQVGDRGLLGDV